MKTIMHEIGVIDKTGNKHPVYFKTGLNIVTGKSSTGKSALIDIFDYCLASTENNIPKGEITKNAAIYYVFLQVNDQLMVIGRNPDLGTRGFFKREEEFSQDTVNADYFDDKWFLDIGRFKKHLTGLFVDVDDVDVSQEARKNRYQNAKAATPSIRSFTSFMLQHQNLVANKHALFYRFDEKAKRDQVVEHTKIFLGLVDQKFFILSQENERIQAELNLVRKEQENAEKVAKHVSQNIEPVLNELYAYMGVEEGKEPIKVRAILNNPQDAKIKLEKFFVAEKISHSSNASVLHYENLKNQLNDKTAVLRGLHRKFTSIGKQIDEEERFVKKNRTLNIKNTVLVSDTVCPFCNTHKDELGESAKSLQLAIRKISTNLASTKPIRAKFDTLQKSVKEDIENTGKVVNNLASQVREIERSEKIIAEQKSLYEAIIMRKARLFSMLDNINLADDVELAKRVFDLEKELLLNNNSLSEYNVKDGLQNASDIVNQHMADIGAKFEFEESYQPINLHFSFETFDLYHQAKDERIYLRSMGSGANWMYCHVTLFLALHRYFAELGDKCAIPTILFFDQPTQVYFPNFKRDEAESFEEVKQSEGSQRTSKERAVDDDIQAVQNLFSRLSEYCVNLEKDLGFSPQIIVTDHADQLVLDNGVSFNSLVNENRWRTRGLIHPIPKSADSDTEVLDLV